MVIFYRNVANSENQLYQKKTSIKELNTRSPVTYNWNVSSSGNQLKAFIPVTIKGSKMFVERRIHNTETYKTLLCNVRFVKSLVVKKTIAKRYAQLHHKKNYLKNFLRLSFKISRTHYARNLYNFLRKNFVLFKKLLTVFLWPFLNNSCWTLNAERTILHLFLRLSFKYVYKTQV